MALTFNLPSQIVVQTAAQWAVDATVYSNKRILVTSDEYYRSASGNTDQRKYKIADGVQTWAQLDYVPIAQSFAAPTNANSSVQIEDTYAGVQFQGANNYGELYVTDTEVDIAHDLKVHIDTPTILLTQSTASRIMATDGSKNIQYLNTATYPNLTELSYVKDVTSSIQTQLNAKLTSANITQVITNGVTDKAPSEDAVYDALALKANTTDTHLLFQGAFAATSLGDSITYYFSNMNGLSATGTQSISKFGFHSNRKITNVVLTCSQNNNYSNEAVYLYLRKNATTDLTITTSLDLSTVGLNTSKVFYYTVDIDVTTGDDYEFKLTTPAFATNGTNSRWHIELYGY